MRSVLEIAFWTSAGLLVYGQFVYPLIVAGLAALRRGSSGSASASPSASALGSPSPAGLEAPHDDADLPAVSLIVAAYREAEVIAAKVENALALDYPRAKLQIIIACDGSPDDTAQIARAAGADLVLELPRGGKMRAQNEAVVEAKGEILAFSDANTMWAPDALRKLVAALANEHVGYVCGNVTFVKSAEDGTATNQEGLYWRYEMWLRERESRLRSITAGNGAIYAVRKKLYERIEPNRGHDLLLPFSTVKHGARALYEPAARADETMVPSIEGEFARKRRMMTFAWPIILRCGMLSPRGYGPTYTWMIFSHRALRYAAPFLHLVALVASGLLARESTLYLVLFDLQLLLVIAAAAAKFVPLKPLLIVRYYALTTLSIALGLWDHLRHGTPAGWTPPEGTR